MNLYVAKKKNVVKSRSLTLTEILERYYNKSISEILEHDMSENNKEVDWGKPVGREYW